MNAQTNSVNVPRIAPLKNVSLFLELVERLVNQPAYMDNRIGVFYGFSGYGKTKAAIYAANKYQGTYIECGYSWTSKTFIDAVLHELTGQPMRGSVADKVQEAIGVMADDARPLIIDEADHLVKKSIIDIVRELHDKSITPIILIGEEKLPSKLLAFERAHNRVSSWVAAQRADMADTLQLVDRLAPNVTIGEDLLRKIIERTEGCTRRIVNNIHALAEDCHRTGRTEIGLADWDEDRVFTGMPMPRRKRTPQTGRAA